MSRFKIALGLVVIAGLGILIAIAVWNPRAPSRALNELGPTARERGRVGEGAAISDKTAPAKASESDAILKSLAKLPSEPYPNDASAPRMQQKQIKMH